MTVFALFRDVKTNWQIFSNFFGSFQNVCINFKKDTKFVHVPLNFYLLYFGSVNDFVKFLMAFLENLNFRYITQRIQQTTFFHEFLQQNLLVQVSQVGNWLLDPLARSLLWVLLHLIKTLRSYCVTAIYYIVTSFSPYTLPLVYTRDMSILNLFQLEFANYMW